jgi:hypothetical protein
MVRTPSGAMARIISIDHALKEATVYWPQRGPCEQTGTFKLKHLSAC